MSRVVRISALRKKRKSVKIEARDDASGQPLWGVISQRARVRINLDHAGLVRIVA